MKQKAAQLGIPYLLKLENGEIAQLNYFDESNAPVYYTIFNTRAATTTGTNTLQPGGSLGLNLTGKGMTVGIYDQTRPKPDHVEFQGRLTQVDGSTETISNHATHVSGTIIAGGISPSARGMAYEATGWAFNWESDLSKMNVNAYDPVSKVDGHLVSNHSYGIVLGWFRNSSNVWTWAGNPSVDPDEEYRFGFYSSKSKGLDELIFSKPYYTVVWAAGNDRDDSGDGSRDPDGPDDNIGPEGVAKNVITVGAVSGIDQYTGPQDVAISGFSSVGPIDDGRIKPDVVGMGVNVFSSAISNGGASDSYASLSGTSMASPNVAGSLLLLQQLFSERNSGRYMWASTVKALMINTTREAGSNVGPDYVYGWGLLNAEAAAQIILNENGSSDVIREESLEQGGVFEKEFLSDGVTPIRVTIAWTDPPGNSPGLSLNPQNLMLVNDLDVRIIDEEGNTFFPYTLNPGLRLSARAETDKDNFRDNVEQIVIPNPKSQNYILRVTHKGELVNGIQDFSLVLSAGTIDGADETLYWVGADGGSWNNPVNWSTTTNGPSADRIPDDGTRVVFEGNEGGSQKVLFPESANAFSVNFFGNQLVQFDLQTNQIAVTNGFRVSNQITEIQNGTLVFDGEGNNELLVELGLATFSEVDLRFESGKWRLISANSLDKVSVLDAELNVEVESLELTDLRLSPNATFGGNISRVDFKNDLSIAQGTNMKEGISLVYDGPSGTFSNESLTQFEKVEVLSGQLDLATDGFRDLNIANGQVTMNLISLSVRDLNLGPEAILNLGNGGSFTAIGELSSDATSTDRARIVAPITSTFNYPIYRKYCFDFIDVNSVNLVGEGIINLGTSAEVTDATGWLQENCEDVLFANFRFEYNCVGAALTFENLSEGAISEYEWDFDGQGTSNLEEPIFVFDQAGTYMVSLKVSNGEEFTIFEQEITVGDSEIVKPNIVANGNVLTSQQPGSSFQWYVNGQIILGATSRSYEVPGDGSYQVAIVEGECNRVSDPVVISAIEEDEPELSRFGVFIGPIPSDDVLNITVANEYTGPIEFQIIDLSGRVLIQDERTKISQEMEVKMNLPGSAGLYILRINTNSLTLHKKVIKQ